MCIEIELEDVKQISLWHKVVDGLNLPMWEEVYSDTRRKPWNAVSIADHSISLSWKGREEFHRL